MKKRVSLFLRTSATESQEERPLESGPISMGKKFLDIQRRHNRIHKILHREITYSIKCPLDLNAFVHYDSEADPFLGGVIYIQHQLS